MKLALILMFMLFLWPESFEVGSSNLGNPTYQKNFFNIASKYAKITTITAEGKGNILPEITYSDYTDKQTFFSEAEELTDSSYLEVFKKNPWYFY